MAIAMAVAARERKKVTSQRRPSALHINIVHAPGLGSATGSIQAEAHPPPRTSRGLTGPPAGLRRHHGPWYRPAAMLGPWRGQKESASPSTVARMRLAARRSAGGNFENYKSSVCRRRLPSTWQPSRQPERQQRPRRLWTRCWTSHVSGRVQKGSNWSLVIRDAVRRGRAVVAKDDELSPCDGQGPSRDVLHASKGLHHAHHLHNALRSLEGTPASCDSSRLRSAYPLRRRPTIDALSPADDATRMRKQQHKEGALCLDRQTLRWPCRCSPSHPRPSASQRQTLSTRTSKSRTDRTDGATALQSARHTPRAQDLGWH
ncbi:hypothetical protein P154DRAFT_574852 [Amniculicola lignicola CBS 123094]|uniref:Uncharacterized protein n=1 Tax=Amniculicola lignicola CBS 123094 TaxID=1392246 RepID=A0A6A5WQZ3_9PLEO|nr:hypothetical protein P154DRAFT_574852 [Amniculicola lignicola CBS 123094]